MTGRLASTVRAGADGNAEALTDVALVECREMHKHFGGVRALDGVEFRLAEGQVHALLGQNGAGKSTLIKSLAGVSQPDRGRIYIDGVETSIPDPHAARELGIGVVYQELSLVPTMTVAANLFLGREPYGRLHRVRTREMQREATRFFEANDLPLRPNDTVGELSFAYRQLTEIAKALIADVRILILDEPTSALSGGEERILFDAIRTVSKTGVGVIYVTHRLAEVFEVSERVTVIRDGRNVATMDTADTDMRSLVEAIVGKPDGRPPDATAQTGASTAPEAGSVAASVKATEIGETQPSSRRGARSDDGTTVLELRGVRNSRLHGVDLTVHAGEIVGLAGMVGSGRTEILETIFGLRPVKSGELRFEGEPVRIRGPQDAVARGLGLAPEDRFGEGLVIDHSIEHNLALPRLAGLTRRGTYRRRESQRRARDAMGELSVVAPGPGTRVGDLSGGNQQKVVLGKWRGPEPRLLLLDEPTNGVDVGAREQIYQLIREAAAKGTGVLVVSSELAELLLICDRIAFVVDGRIVDEVSVDGVASEEDLHHLVQEHQR